MKKIMFILIMFFCLSSYSQVRIYKTYNDYINNKGQEFDDYKTYYYSAGNVKLTFLKNKKKVKIKCKDIWGFKYGDALYRIDTKYAQPTKVITIGKVCYYENGLAHLTMQKRNKKRADIKLGSFCYLSKSLDSEIIAMTYKLFSGNSKKLKKFKTQYPEYKELFKCIEGDYHYSIVRGCIDEFYKS